MKKTKLAAWLVLTIVAVVAAACLAATNEITKDVISEASRAATQAAWAQLVPDAAFPEADEAGEDAASGDYVYAGVRDGETVGYVGATTVQGYGGEIEVIVGTDTEGVITGINVGGENFKETAGLGAKAKDEAFTGQFAGKTAPLSLGEDIDAITASTITSNAVVRGVNNAIDNIAAVAGFTVESEPAEGGSLGDGRYAATAKGFAGPVYVEIQLNDDYVIEDIVIGDDQFAETAGYGQKAKEPAFYEQFIGKTGQLTLGEDIDAISGATITSEAVVDAVNLAMLYATDPDAAAAQTEDTATVELPDIPEGALTETASRKGFGGPVAATITIDPDTHALLRVEFGDDAWAETEGIGSKIQEESFWSQFIGKTLPLADGDIDAVTGATVTSIAAIEAVNKAYYKLFPDAEPSADATPEPEAGDVGQDGNVATASSKGYGGPVAVTLTIRDGNVIDSVAFGDDNWAETDGIGSKIMEDDFVAQFAGKTLPLGDGDIDVITGATVTSEAAIAAVNKAYGKIVDAQGDAADDAGETPSDADAPQEEANPDVATASSKGYGGPVAVTLTIRDGNVIDSVVFGDDNWAETDGIGSKIKEDDFAAQFAGKTLPLGDGDIDAITGATVTSEAAIAAVNKAYGKITDAQGDADDAGETPSDTDAPQGGANPDVATASSKGYGGPVAVTLIIKDGNVIDSVVFGDDNWAETDGIGSKIMEDDFAAQFAGKTLPLGDGDIDAITGATVTSEAAIAAVNKAYGKITDAQGDAVDDAGETPSDADAPQEEANPDVATASSKGYGGPVAVALTIRDGNVIDSVAFGDDNWAETDGIGSKIMEDDFAAQFAGKTLPLGDGDIDVITGATVTSEAAVAAVNKAYGKIVDAQGDAADDAGETPSDTDAPQEEANPDVATASSKGYGGPVAVTLTIKDGNVIDSVVFGDDNWAETDGIGSKIKEDDFVAQFAGKTLPLGDGDIDVITGATVTSEAAVAAVNKAYGKIVDARNTATASADGFGGPIEVTITLDAEGKLSGLTIGGSSFAETEGRGARVKEDAFIAQFIGKSLPVSDEDIDAISEATISSKAVIEAVNKAYEALRAQ